MKQGNESKVMKFKVGDIVKIARYNEELDLWWPKSTVGMVVTIADITEDGNYCTENGYIYSGTEMELVKVEESKLNVKDYVKVIGPSGITASSWNEGHTDEDIGKNLHIKCVFGGKPCLYKCTDDKLYYRNELELIKSSTKKYKFTEPEDILLSQAELQFLVKILSKRLDVMEMNIGSYKDMAEYLWDNADKEEEQGEQFFEQLNSCKDSLRKKKKSYGKLASIQRKLKKQMS